MQVPMADRLDEAFQLGRRRPFAVLFVSMLAVLLLAAGSARLEFDPQYSTFFDADDEQLVAFEHLRDVFSPSDALIFIVEPSGSSLFDPPSLAQLEQLTSQAWRLPALRRSSRMPRPLPQTRSSAWRPLPGRLPN